MTQKKTLGTIQNNDVNNILFSSSGKGMTPDEYRTAVGHLLDGRPNVLAQNVGVGRGANIHSGDVCSGNQEVDAASPG